MSDERDRRIEDELRAHLRAEADAVRTPAGFASRILATIRSERNAPALEDRIGYRIRADAQRVRAPSDMPARVRGAIGASRRRRLLPRLILVPALAAAVALALFAVTSVRQGNEGDETLLTAQQVLARAAVAAEDPASVGLESYTGTLRLREEGMRQLAQEPESYDVSIWFQAPDRYRQVAEHAPAANAATAGSLKIISDGEMLWYYDDSAGAYFSDNRSRSNSDASQSLLRVDPFVPSALATSIDEVIAQLQEAPDGSIALSESRVAGRDAYVLDAVHVEFACVGARCPLRGHLRLWLDKQFLVPLRSEINVPDAGGEAVIEFSRIDFNAPVDEALFAFVPPGGALSYTVATRFLPPGTLAPSWIPQGYGISEDDSDGDGASSTSVSYRLVNATGGYINIGQLPASTGGVGSTLGPPANDDDSLDAYPGLRVERLDGQRRVVSRAGDYVITVTANQLSDEELLRFIESMASPAEDLDGDGAP